MNAFAVHCKVQIKGLYRFWVQSKKKCKFIEKNDRKNIKNMKLFMAKKPRVHVNNEFKGIDLNFTFFVKPPRKN
jgi:nucleoside-specific outer membrane channel protein Tsx